MLGFLFRTLTAGPPRGAALFDALTQEARRAHWYVEGAVPDTLDGRFAVLATVASLAIVRLEREGEPGIALSVALTERFIEVMESEHRELGLGDPALGRTVRKLVGSLARRTELWRAALDASGDGFETTLESLYTKDAPPAAVRHSADALKALGGRLSATRFDHLELGKIA